ncbi:MAG: hypothetical protein ACJLS3_02095 [Erythrobacter sp.]
MLDQVPDPPLAAENLAQIARQPAAADPQPAPIATPRPAAPLVIDILARTPLPEQCAGQEADPFNPEIIVCQQAAPPPRLSKSIGPELDDFGNAIPQARVKLSEHAEAQANLINKSVGGWNANGAEVRLKFGF